jgi:glucosyl-3-phosphoglycerate synthase
MAATAAERWVEARTFHHSQFPAALLAAERSESVTVCLPARECATTVGAIVAELAALRDAGVLDEILVVDAGSRDGTAEVAVGAGATVVQESDLVASAGPVLGKGDAMWRALSVIESDVVCFLDADTRDFGPHFATGLLGPLLCDPAVAFVKGCYRRPFTQGDVSLPDGGGRVSQLMARPALTLFYPDLAGVSQPLAGEVAARRELLARLPFTSGYGVETAMLIDVWKAVGLDAMAQVDLDERRNAHQSLAKLSHMAYAVLTVIARRLEAEGRLSDAGAADPRPLLGPDGPQPVALVERPPLVATTRDGAR